MNHMSSTNIYIYIIYLLKLGPEVLIEGGWWGEMDRGEEE